MSNRKAGKNDDGDRTPSSAVRIQADNFLELAGSVNVPRAKKGISWTAIKSAIWLRRAASRKEHESGRFPRRRRRPVR
jgi:hypothetical protein